MAVPSSAMISYSRVSVFHAVERLCKPQCPANTTLKNARGACRVMANDPRINKVSEGIQGVV